MQQDQPRLLQPRRVFDQALLGVARKAGYPRPIAIYDHQGCVESMARASGLGKEAATTVVDRIAAHQTGPGAPLLLLRLPDQQQAVMAVQELEELFLAA